MPTPAKVSEFPAEGIFTTEAEREVGKPYNDIKNRGLSHCSVAATVTVVKFVRESSTFVSKGHFSALKAKLRYDKAPRTIGTDTRADLRNIFVYGQLKGCGGERF